ELHAEIAAELATRIELPRGVMVVAPEAGGAIAADLRLADAHAEDVPEVALPGGGVGARLGEARDGSRESDGREAGHQFHLHCLVSLGFKGTRAGRAARPAEEKTRQPVRRSVPVTGPGARRPASSPRCDRRWP